MTTRARTLLYALIGLAIGASFSLVASIAFADNVTITQGSGKTIGMDDITSVNYQRIKLIYGADGVNSGDVATSNPFPVQFRTSGGTETGTAGNPIQCSLANTGSNGTAITVASHAVTNAGTFAVQVDGAALTALQLIDDPVIADDAAFTPATTKVHMCGFEFDDSSPDSVDEGDGGAARMSSRREQYMQIRDAAGNERGANVNASNQLAIAGPVTNAGTFAVQVDGSLLTSSQLIDDAIVADDAAFTPATTKVMMAGAELDDTAPDAPDEGDGGALRMSSRRSLYVEGNIAHDAADAANPIVVGGRAETGLPTAVADNDVAHMITDVYGRPLVSHIDPTMQVWKSFNATTTQTGTDVWSPASGKKIAITSYVISTYGTTGCRVILWFGDNADTTFTAGTDQQLIAASFVPSATTKPGVAPPLRETVYCTTADRELHITTDAGCSIDVTAYGYEF